jgi:hypothetical protein
MQVLGKVSFNNNNTPYKVKHQREIDVKLANDSYVDESRGESYIWGCCMTLDGSLLLCDNNTKKLKHLDVNKGTVKDYIEFQACPRDVCLVSSTEAAVTMNNNSIEFVSLLNKLTAARTLTINHACVGLAFKDNKLFISDGEKNVYIHDINGNELRTISTDASGNAIFQYIRHITVNAAGDKVFVSDFGKGLIMLDIHGQYLSTLNEPTLSGIQAVVTDGRNMFVCGWSSNNVVQIEQSNNKLLGEIYKIVNPLSLCLDSHKSRLIISQTGNNKITILDLEK